MYTLLCLLVWLHWVFIAVRGLFPGCREQELLSSCNARASAVAVQGRISCDLWPESLQASAVAAGGRTSSASKALKHGLSSCSTTCGIFRGQWLNTCPLHILRGGSFFLSFPRRHQITHCLPVTRVLLSLMHFDFWASHYNFFLS